MIKAASVRNWKPLAVRLNAAFSRFSWKSLEDCVSIFDHPLITKPVLGAL